jgi:hypothetical protein
MKEDVLHTIRDLIQEDVGGRGLRTDPEVNLITVCAGDFRAACRSVAAAPRAALAIVTGFLIPHAEPPAGETDGPLGALFLARALVPLGIRVALVTDAFCTAALKAGLEACGLREAVPLVTLPAPNGRWEDFLKRDWRGKFREEFPLTHLITLERVGPSHTAQSVRAQPGSSPAVVEQFLREVPAEHHDRCHTMRGRDITAGMSPAHLLFEAAGRQTRPVTTVGIGDGGNEIGMGKVPWEVIRRNVPGGGLVACRVPVDYLIVCGVSNWGAYGLAAGVRLLRDQPRDRALFDVKRERDLLRIMVERGPLVDGVTGKPTVSVDGLPFERYAEPLRRLAELG